MSQNPIASLKVELHDLADNLCEEKFSTLSSGIGLGDLTPRVEKNRLNTIADQEEHLLKTSEAAVAAQYTSADVAGVAIKEELGLYENAKFGKVCQHSESIVKDINQRGKISRAKKGLTARGKHKKSLKVRPLLAHFIDLSVACVGFLVAFIAVLGMEASWDRALLAEVINDFGIGYVALFSYGTFLIYHLVFRMLRLPMLGQIIVKARKSLNTKSSKAKRAFR